MSEQKPEYYDLVPHYGVPDGAIGTAACVICIATGRILSGMGGPGRNPIAPEIVDALRNDGTPKAIVPAADADALAEAQARIAELEAALIQARGALRIDAMVQSDGQPYGTTTAALEAIDAALAPEGGDDAS